MRGDGHPNCRTHPSTTSLLRESRAPAVLIEPGFLTHPEEGRELLEPSYQMVIASALVDALQRFLAARAPPPPETETVDAPRSRLREGVAAPLASAPGRGTATSASA